MGIVLAIPALGIWKQGDRESKDTLNDIGSDRPAWDTQNPFSKQKTIPTKTKSKRGKRDARRFLL